MCCGKSWREHLDLEEGRANDLSWKDDHQEGPKDVIGGDKLGDSGGSTRGRGNLFLQRRDLRGTPRPGSHPRRPCPALCSGATLQWEICRPRRVDDHLGVQSTGQPNAQGRLDQTELNDAVGREKSSGQLCRC